MKEGNCNDDVDEEVSNGEEIISDSNVNVEKKGEGREGLIGKRNEKESGINCDNEGSIEEKENIHRIASID
ncbi:hypothetical protein, partial [Staphylococcus epidermidis]|uniref:hypothetical protein n=1 Tax=Staphylococcus epidermidis TaxID=1282 RepID=UPI0011A27C07